MDFEEVCDTLSRWSEVKENEVYLDQLKLEGGKTYEVDEPRTRADWVDGDFEKARNQLPDRVQSLADSFLVEYDQSSFGEIKVEPTYEAEELLELDTVEQVINYVTLQEIELDEMYK